MKFPPWLTNTSRAISQPINIFGASLVVERPSIMPNAIVTASPDALNIFVGLNSIGNNFQNLCSNIFILIIFHVPNLIIIIFYSTSIIFLFILLILMLIFILMLIVNFSFPRLLTYIIILTIRYNLSSMATFGHSTIHSKLAKFQKISDDVNSGRVVKGVNSEFGINRTVNKSYWSSSHNPSEIMRQIEILPKSKLNINRKMRNKRIIPGIQRNDEIVLMQSSVFPAIYFKKTALRNILKGFSFPPNCQQISPEDQRITLIYQIISNLFSEINFFIFNIMSGQNMDNNSYYIFFSDCETLPFTKCCNAPVFLELQQNGSGKILCNSTECKNPSLAQFLINFDDGRRLWPNIPYFAEASAKDKELKSKISKLIINGKYKKKSLVEMVQDTSQQIVNLFYESKKIAKMPSDNQSLADMANFINDENTFVTGPGLEGSPGHLSRIEKLSHNNRKSERIQLEDPEIDASNIDTLLQQQESNIQTLKMKLKYITKKQTDFPKKLSKSIVQESKIFQHKFDIIRKIDEQMLRNRNARTTSKISFPQLMTQIQRSEKIKNEREKESQNKTYHY